MADLTAADVAKAFGVEPELIECSDAEFAEVLHLPVRPTCPSRFLCMDEGWIACEEPEGHDSDDHRGLGHAWDDDMAVEAEEWAAEHAD